MSDLSAIRDLVLEINQFAHGVDAVVTRPAPNDTPIEARALWLTTVSEQRPIGGDAQVSEPQRVMVLSRAEVPSVPRGTLIVAPEKAGAADQTWQVDGEVGREADQIRVLVLPVDEAS